MKVFSGSGIVVQNKDCSLIFDPSRKVKASDDVLVGISHAHSDHVKNHDCRMVATHETADLFPFKNEVTKYRYHKPFEFDGMTITQHNANHILGSSQFEVNDGNETVVYTGDFRLNDSSLFGCCDVPKCDKLVIESTYGMPHFKFPKHDEVRSEIEKWVKTTAKDRNLLFGSYALGKSQEIIEILNDIGIVPVVHPKVARFSEVYNRHGHKLQFLESGTDEGNKTLSNRFVAVMPPSLINSEFISSMQSVTNCKISSALLTGWGMLYNFNGMDKVFIMSDHADFYQIMDYVKRSGAKKVYTVHGYANELAHQLSKRLNIDAVPLKENSLEAWA